MAEHPNFPALAHAIALAAGRMAHGSTPVQSVVDRLAADLADSWAPKPSYSAPDFTADERHRHTIDGVTWEHAHEGGHEAHDGDMHYLGDALAVDPAVSRVDTPAQHITWATNLIGQMSRQRLDSGQTYAVEEALSHLRRAAELIRDEIWADAPAGLDDDPDTHGPGCSNNPEIGCVCGLAERQSEEDERQHAPDRRPVAARLAAEMAETARVASQRFPNDYDAAVRYVRDLVSEEGA